MVGSDSLGSGVKVYYEIWKLPRPIWAIFWTSLINRMGTMVMPFLLLYLTQHLGIPADKAVRIFWVYGLTTFSCSMAFGWLSDRFGSERMMATSLFGFAAVLMAFPFARTLGQAMVGAFFLALFGESFRPAVVSTIAHHARGPQRKIAFAFHRLAINAGMSIGPLLGGFLYARSYKSIFWVDAVSSLCALAIIVFFLWPHARRPLEAGAPARTLPKGGFAHALTDRALLALTFSLVPVMMVFHQHDSTLSLFVTRHLGLSEAWYGSLFTVNTLLIVLLEVPLNVKTSAWEDRYAMTLGALLFALGFGFMAFASTIGVLYACVALWTFGEMILFPTMSNYVTHLAPPGYVGLYTGLYSMSFSLAFVLGPWVGAKILVHGGPQALWFVCGALGTVSMLAFSKIPRRDESRVSS